MRLVDRDQGWPSLTPWPKLGLPASSPTVGIMISIFLLHLSPSFPQFFLLPMPLLALSTSCHIMRYAM